MSEREQIGSLTAAGYVTFVAAGEQAVGDYHCSECGYGVSVLQRLPYCPMCQGGAWEPAPVPALRLQ
jgi:hypothetical protein